MKNVTVIGLGQMGSKIASLLLHAEWRVHAWNRSRDKTMALAQAGVTMAETAADAVRQSEIVVMCVRDYQVASEILDTPEMREALNGKRFIQLTTGSPEDAEHAYQFMARHGAGYLDGAIQVAPEQMGLPDTTILLSGSAADYAQTRDLWPILGGNVVYLGESAAGAATMDLATLSYVYGASIGVFQGAALAEAAGLDIGVYGAIIQTMSPSFGDFLKHEADVIAQKDFTISQSPLSISVDATRRIENAVRKHGLNPDFSAIMRNLLRQAESAGLADEEFAAVTKVLGRAGAATGAQAVAG